MLSRFDVLIVNLAAADFLMGVYLAVIGAADRYYHQSFLHQDQKWRASTLCTLAGVLCLTSCEVGMLLARLS